MRPVALLLSLVVSFAHHHAVPKYEPYFGCTQNGGCQHWAVPPCIVNAESKGEVHEASHPSYASGAYQIERSTWTAMGGLRWAWAAYEATKNEQSWIAYKLWDHGRGASQWETASLCGY